MEPNKEKNLSRRNLYIFTLIALLVGLMLAIQMQSNAEPQEMDSRDLLSLRKELQDERERQQELKSEIFKQQLLKSKYVNASKAGGDVTEVMEKELETARRLAGYTVLEGPGLLLTIDVQGASFLQEDLEEVRKSAYRKMIDDDLRSLVDELFGNGAKAIAINGYRLVTNSTIRKVGDSIQVNTVPVVLPLEISVIGDADMLLPGLQVSGLPEIFPDIGLEMKTTVKEFNVVPAYRGTYSIQYMQRMKESE